MALHFEIDTDKVVKRVDAMVQKIATLPIAREFTAWQREDMHRHYPTTQESSNPTAVQTSIFPRSRKPSVRKKPPQSKRPLFRGRIQRVNQPASTRPILRPNLYDKLCARMANLMETYLRW
jgi:hypothetical protein